MSNITELGYLGLSISDLEHWKTFACEVVGMEFLDEGEEGKSYLRMDEWHHRIVLHHDGGDDLAYIGWRVAGPNELDAMADRLDAAGVEFRRGSEEEAAERRVLGLLKLDDPGGNKIEIFWGPQVDCHKPFHPGRPMHGRFRTGEQGMGHIVITQTDIEEAIRFYELLGFTGSVGYVFKMPDGGSTKPVFMHVNGRQHSIAFLPPLPMGKSINHLMAEYTDMKDLGMTHDRIRAKGFDVALQLGMHSNDQVLSFYAGNPSKWTWELGWGGREGPAQQEYHIRDIFGHAPEATGYGLDLPIDGSTLED